MLIKIIIRMLTKVVYFTPNLTKLKVKINHYHAYQFYLSSSHRTEIPFTIDKFNIFWQNSYVNGGTMMRSSVVVSPPPVPVMGVVSGPRVVSGRAVVV